MSVDYSIFHFQGAESPSGRPVLRMLSAAAVFLVSAGPQVVAGTSGDVRVLRSDQRSLVIEFTPRYPAPREIRQGVDQYTLYDFDHAVAPSSAESSGQPDLRFRSIALGFPSKDGNAVQVISADYEDIPNVVIAPVPSLKEIDGMIGVGEFARDPKEYGTSGFVPRAIARLSGIGRVRSRFVGSLQISPVLFDPATHTVRKYTRIVVEVAFGLPRLPAARKNDHAILGDLLLNESVARNWEFASGEPRVSAGAPSVLASGTWYRIPVSTEGVYIIDAVFLRAAGIEPANIDPRTMKIYGNGGQEVPELITSARPQDLVENAVYVQGESDGVFDDEDFLIFYARPTRGWTYNASTHLFDHYINHYSDVNTYWFTYGGATGKRMVQQPSLPDPGSVVPDHFTSLVLVDEDTINILGSGKDWYGPTINANSSKVYSNSLPGLVPGISRTYKFSMIAKSIGVTPSMTVQEGSTLIWQGSLPSIIAGDLYTAGREQIVTVTSTAAVANNASQLTFTYNTASTSGTAWLNWLEIQYPRSFTAVSNYLRFRSPDTTGVVQYTLNGFTASPFILDVSVPEDVKIITGATGTYTFKASAAAGTVAEYCAVGAGAYKVPASLTSVTNQNIRGITDGYDFIIITAKEFRSAADRLAAYREQPAHGDLRTYVVEVDQIYNEFGGGLPDVTAIRDFLKYAYDNWSRVPSYVLFFGQGSYDYKGRLGFKSSYVPAWQSKESLKDLLSFTSDDYFVKFDASSSSPFIISGRLNPRSLAEADVLVDKLESYEDGSARDPWKMRILIVGDDSWTPEQEDGSIHSAQAESLAENNVPEVMEKRKIYIAEYPTVITGQGRRKPDAFQAIIDEINRGVLIVNYTGHGNPSVWAHESIFTVQTSIPQLVNADRLAVFFLATCNFSDFDDPNRYTGGELLLNKADGGAVGVMSATRKVFAIENFNLNVDIYERMFLSDAFGRPVVDRPATALYRAKVESTNSLNDQKFFYMGDPTMRLQFPSGFASIDTIAGMPVDTVNGAPRADANPINIKALQKVTLKGVLRSAESNLPDTLTDGTIIVVVNDATRQISIPGFPPGAAVPFSYAATGATVYRGANSVTDGDFDAQFIVPKDISYADSTTRGRLVGYYYNSVSDGFGFTDKIFVGGTDTTAAADEVGPAISMYLNTRSFRPGDLVSSNPTLLVDLVDSSGINTSTAGIGHRIEAWLNGSTQSIDITDFYSSDLDNYQRGTVQYELKDIPYGHNTLKVRAWDAYNNSSTADTYFELTSGDKLTITDVFNYPNPFARETSFTFRQNQLVPLNVSIKIYTVAGRLIQTLDTMSPGEPFIQVAWDGRDRDGDTLANGVYLYKIIASTVDGKYSSEALGKLTVIR